MAVPNLFRGLLEALLQLPNYLWLQQTAPRLLHVDLAFRILDDQICSEHLHSSMQAQLTPILALQKFVQTGTGLMGSGMGITGFSRGYSKGSSHAYTYSVTARRALRCQLVMSMHTCTPETAPAHHAELTQAPSTLEAKWTHVHLKKLLSIMHIWTGVHHVCSHTGKPSGSLLTKACHFRVYGTYANVCCPCYCSRQWQCALLDRLCIGHLGCRLAQWISAAKGMSQLGSICP